jgi:hypothetical protein
VASEKGMSTRLPAKARYAPKCSSANPTPLAYLRGWVWAGELWRNKKTTKWE